MSHDQTVLAVVCALAAAGLLVLEIIRLRRQLAALQACIRVTAGPTPPPLLGPPAARQFWGRISEAERRHATGRPPPPDAIFASAIADPEPRERNSATARRMDALMAEQHSDWWWGRGP